jgi:hypothetical protein
MLALGHACKMPVRSQIRILRADGAGAAVRTRWMERGRHRTEQGAAMAARGTVATMSRSLFLSLPCLKLSISRSLSLPALSVRRFSGEQQPLAAKIHKLHRTIPKLIATIASP